MVNFVMAFDQASRWIDHWAALQPEFEIERGPCRICGSLARADIDRMVVTGWEYEQISDLFNAILRREDWLTPQRVERHVDRHMRSNKVTDEFIASAREAAARYGSDASIGTNGAGHDEPEERRPKGARAYLESFLAAGTVAIETGVVVPEPRDVLRALKQLDPHGKDPTRLEAFTKTLEDNLLYPSSRAAGDTP